MCLYSTARETKRDLARMAVLFIVAVVVVRQRTVTVCAFVASLSFLPGDKLFGLVPTSLSTRMMMIT